MKRFRPCEPARKKFGGGLFGSKDRLWLDGERRGSWGASYLVRWLPKNAARRIVIDQACTAAILGSGWHPGFRRIGSAIAVSAYRQSG